MNTMQSRPGPVIVQMPDGQPYIIKRLLSAANHKQEKGQGYRSVGLTLTPRATAHAGLNLCRFATEGCARSCFGMEFYGRQYGHFFHSGPSERSD